MSNESCNGWANYETWAIHIWATETGIKERIIRYANSLILNAMDKNSPKAIKLLKAKLRSNYLDLIKADLTYDLTEYSKKIISDYRDELGLYDSKYGLFVDLLNSAIGRVDWRELVQAYMDECPAMDFINQAFTFFGGN